MSPPERALELVRWDAVAGRFELGAEALAVLRGLGTPIGVVAVCGRARQVRCPLLSSSTARQLRGARRRRSTANPQLPPDPRASPSSSTSCWLSRAASRSARRTGRAPRCAAAWLLHAHARMPIACTPHARRVQPVMQPQPAHSTETAACMQHNSQGLWMWSAPQPRVDAEGRPYHLVLLDTEGIDAYDQVCLLGEHK